MAGVITYGMNDTGKRRIDYLMELQDLWSAGLAIATQGYMVKSDIEAAAKLEIGLELLAHHLQNDYDCRPYARAINELPESEKAMECSGKSCNPHDEDEEGLIGV